MTGFEATAQVEIKAPVERVWQALTAPEEVGEWMHGTRLQTTWEVGSPITWDGEYEGRAYQDKGEVLTVDPPYTLSMTHYSPMMGRDDAPENYHTVTYDLAASGGDDTTRVALTQDGNESEEQAQQFSQNWQQMLEGLKAHVEG